MLLETGGGIKNIERWIGNEPTLVYNGDILTDINLQALIAEHNASENTATLALLAQGSNCNVGVEGTRVVDLRGLRGITPGSHQFSDIYIIEPQVLELIPAEQKVSIIPAFITLAEQGTLGFDQIRT